MFDVASYFIKKKTTSVMVMCILLVGGYLSFNNLSRLEDPEFSIKQINIITQYPGATPKQVEDEVTYLLETEMQRLSYVKEIKSTSKAGVSKLQVAMKDTTPGDTLGQVWDEVRKKISDIESQFPPGVHSPIVVDDFSDVYGVLYSLSAENTGDFSYRDLENIASDLTKELALVEGVSKVTIAGKREEQVHIEISRSNLMSLGIPAEQVAGLLSEQNVVSNAGYVDVGEEFIRLAPTGEFNSIEELGLLTLTSSQTGNTVKLMDIATIKKVYKEPANHVMHFNGKPSLGLGVSFLSGVNVVEVGERVRSKIQEHQSLIPLGVSLDSIYFQGDEVELAVDGFLKSLLQAVAIVVLVLLIFMGLKSGVIIGLVLSITIFGTFIIMDITGIALQRISLGGLVIALGMLVDNAIVVTEGILIGMKRGKSKIAAASEVVSQTKWPLLGATVIAITAFAPIGLSPDSTGEFVGSLFWVLLISLMISWFTAIAITPYLCDLMFKEAIEQAGSDDDADPYKGLFFTLYKKILTLAMNHKWLSIAFLVLALVISLLGFKELKQAFFPSSATPMFFLELRYPEGASMAVTEEKVATLEAMLNRDERVDYVTSTINQGFPRFILTYSAIEPGANNAQLVIRTHDQKIIDALFLDIDAYLKVQQPEVKFTLRKMQLGPPGGAKLETRFQGPDSEVLKALSLKVQQVYSANPYLEGIRDDWKQPVKVLQPRFNAERASELGITKKDYDTALLRHLQGQRVGVYREDTNLLPIMITAPKAERNSVDQLKDIQIFSQGRYVNITEITDSFDLIWEDPIIERRDRQRTITVMADPKLDSSKNAAELFGLVASEIEAIELPAGYTMEFGGEFENSSNAKANIGSSVPIGYLFMFIITILLFDSFKDSLMVWLCVPLMLIGVVSGLLMLDVAFGFMGFLGLLSLTGMVVKNGIVLIEQVKIELDEGKAHYQAMFDAAVSRLRPVSMAALTTILGLLPLFFDPFFKDMAVVISFGLGFATILTLVAIPVFYVTFYSKEVKSEA